MVNLSVNFLIKSLSPVSLSNSVSAFGFSCSLVKHRDITYYAGHHNVLCFNFSRAASGIVSCREIDQVSVLRDLSLNSTAKVRHFSDTAKFRHPNSSDFQQQLTGFRRACFRSAKSMRASLCTRLLATLTRFLHRANGGGGASLSKPVVEFVELWNPFHRFHKVHKWKIRHTSSAVPLYITNYIS